MKGGPRLFALAVLAALVLLPRTGWIVRNHLDLLGGGWARFGQDLGLRGRFGVVPNWPFETGAVQDPAARALTDPVVGRGETGDERLARTQIALDDPLVRPKVRGPMLRRAFTSILPRQPRLADHTRRTALRVLPLTVEGERANPANAFYPACAWVLYDVLGDRKASEAALARAGRAAYYDDEAGAEARLVIDGIEREHGYRGSALRLVARGSVLLPEYAAMNAVVDRRLVPLPLDDPRRLSAVRLGETMVRTGPDPIAVHVGRGLMLRAMARTEGFPKPGEETGVLRAYAAANGVFDLDGARRIVRALAPEPAWDDMGDGLKSSLPPVAAAILLAFLAALALAWPAKKPLSPPEDRAALRRALWAWLGLVPAAFLTGGGPDAVLGTVVLTLFVVYLGWRAPLDARRSLALVALPSVALVAASPQEPRWIVPFVGWALALLAFQGLRPQTGFAGAGTRASCDDGHGSLLVVLLWAVGLGIAAWGAVSFGLGPHEPVMVGLCFVAFVLGLRFAFPLPARTVAWVPAVFAVLYVGAVVVELAEDGQRAEVVRAFDRQGAELRRRAGI